MVGKGADALKIELDKLNTSVEIHSYNQVGSLVDEGFYNSIQALVRLDEPFRLGRTLIEAVAHECPVVVSNQQLSAGLCGSNISKNSSLIIGTDYHNSSQLCLALKGINLQRNPVKQDKFKKDKDRYINLFLTKIYCE